MHNTKQSGEKPEVRMSVRDTRSPIPRGQSAERENQNGTQDTWRGEAERSTAEHGVAKHGVA